MMRTRCRVTGLSIVCLLVALTVAAPRAQRGAAPTAPTPGNPILTVETAKGTVEMRLFQTESPKSAAQIIALVKRGFYRGQRIIRVENSLVQFGDPASRDMSRKDWWGRASSGNPIGVAEFNKQTHVRGAVGLAHGGDAKYADSQLYILKTASPSLNGKHVVIGQVTRGMEVVDKLQVADVIRATTIRE